MHHVRGLTVLAAVYWHSEACVPNSRNVHTLGRTLERFKAERNMQVLSNGGKHFASFELEHVYRHDLTILKAGGNRITAVCRGLKGVRVDLCL